MTEKFYQLVELVPGSTVQTKTRVGQISDGYHTFDELYHYRALYNAALFNEWAMSDSWHEQIPQKGHFFNVHKSRKHSDGKFCFDAGGEWFVVVADLPTGQITNHYHADYWKLFKIPVKGKADKWDGHDAQEAAKRLEQFLLGDW